MRHLVVYKTCDTVMGRPITVTHVLLTTEPPDFRYSIIDFFLHPRPQLFSHGGVHADCPQCSVMECHDNNLIACGKALKELSVILPGLAYVRGVVTTLQLTHAPAKGSSQYAGWFLTQTLHNGQQVISSTMMRNTTSGFLFSSRAGQISTEVKGRFQ
jgi:hypothetical protein